MAVTGDFSRLALLRQRLERLANGDGFGKVMAKLADEAHKQAVAGFQQQRDPYGRPWAPRKKPKAEFALRFGHVDNGHPLLDDTGAGINSLRARVVGRTTIRFSTQSYMKFHLTGTKVMSARKWLPVDGLGPIWGEAFLRVTGDEVRRQLGVA